MKEKNKLILIFFGLFILLLIESFEEPQNSKLSKKDFDAISFGNIGYSKSSIKIVSAVSFGSGSGISLKISNETTNPNNPHENDVPANTTTNPNNTTNTNSSHSNTTTINTTTQETQATITAQTTQTNSQSNSANVIKIEGKKQAQNLAQQEQTNMEKENNNRITGAVIGNEKKNNLTLFALITLLIVALVVVFLAYREF